MPTRRVHPLAAAGARLHELEDQLLRSGRLQPLRPGEPCRTPYDVYSLARSAGLVSETEYCEAYRLFDWRWSYTGD